MHRNPPSGPPKRDYFVLGMKLFFALFAAMWVIVVVLYDQHFHYGEGDGATIVTASKNPVYYWGTNIFFAGLFIVMIVVCIRDEKAFRKTVSDWHAEQSYKPENAGTHSRKSGRKGPRRRPTRRQS